MLISNLAKVTRLASKNRILTFHSSSFQCLSSTQMKSFQTCLNQLNSSQNFTNQQLAKIESFQTQILTRSLHSSKSYFSSSSSDPNSPNSDQKLESKRLSDERVRSSREQYQSFHRRANRTKNQDLLLYATALALFALACSYAAVPLYRIYCQSTGLGGKPTQTHDFSENKLKTIQKVNDRPITVKFNADAESQLSWNFKPTQTEIKVYPGETALAFYTAKNPLDVPINGVATYSVVPFEAGPYLNKVQCFCFEEQRLNPDEEVDLPVFFYFDPEFAYDPRLENVEEVVLSYTFFEAKNGVQLPFFNKNTNVV